MKLPKFLQPDEATIEEYEGDTAYEPEYADPYGLEGYMEESRTYVRNDDGDQVVSSSQFFTSEEVDPPPKSKFNYDGKEYIVITVSKNKNALTGEQNHVEIALE